MGSQVDLSRISLDYQVDCDIGVGSDFALAFLMRRWKGGGLDLDNMHEIPSF